MPRERRQWEQERLERVRAEQAELFAAVLRAGRAYPREEAAEREPVDLAETPVEESGDGASREIPGEESGAVRREEEMEPAGREASYELTSERADDEPSDLLGKRPRARKRGPRKGQTKKRRLETLSWTPVSRPAAIAEENWDEPEEPEPIMELRSGSGVQETAPRPRPRTLPPRITGVMFGGLDPVPIDWTVDPPPRTCFNCWQEGHESRKCPRPKKRVYCANCGRSGEDLRSCPRCSRVHRAFVLSGWEKALEAELDRRNREELRREREERERRERESDLRALEAQALQEAQRARERLALVRGIQEARSELQRLRREQMPRTFGAPEKAPRCAPTAERASRNESRSDAAECSGVWSRLGPRKALINSYPALVEAQQRQASARRTLAMSAELLRRLTSRPVEPVVQPPVTGEAQRILQALARMRREDREAIRRRLEAEFPPHADPK